MSKIVLSIDTENIYLEETKDYLLHHDCKVYSFSEKGQDLKTCLEEIERQEGRIDLLLLSADSQLPPDNTIEEGHDCGQLLDLVSEQINRMQTAIDAALPLLRRSELKCLGMITTRASSISYCREDRGYGRHMAWAGMNMAGKLYFNLLRPEGFRFRWYCAEETSGGIPAGEYLLSKLCYDEKEPYLHSDENRFVMRDAWLREIPW